MIRELADLEHYLDLANKATLHGLPGETKAENLVGIATPVTLSRPSAVTARLAVTAESMPPDSPRIAEEKPHFLANFVFVLGDNTAPG